MLKRVYTRSLLAFAIVLGTVTGVTAGTAPRPLSDAGVHLLDEILRPADYETETDREQAHTSIRIGMEALLGRLAGGAPTMRKARRLHRLLHRDWLIEYDADADRLETAVLEGRFNCLSGTLLYALAASELGYKVRVVETPGHLFLELEADGRQVVVESTSIYGFNAPLYDVAIASDLAVEDSRWLRLESPGTRPAESHTGLWRVELAEAVGFVWLNRAWQQLDEGEITGSVAAVAEAQQFLTVFAPRSKGVDRLLTRAFHLSYERGSFDEAYYAATIAHGLYPRSTSVRDRVFASALKILQSDAETSNLKHADLMLIELRSLFQEDDTFFLPFERSILPELIVAAVRVGNYDRAQRWQTRYEAIEPDRVESMRLGAWLTSRRAGVVSWIAGARITF